MKNDFFAIEKAFNEVRNELCDMGLFRGEYGYLDQIELVQSPLPAVFTQGFVFDEGLHWSLQILGYEEGVIYIRRNPSVSGEFGQSLKDIVRHEYGHAWAWLDSDLFDQNWFKKAFGGEYWDEYGPDSEYTKIMEDLSYSEFQRYDLSDEYITPYALTNPAEDFAETFMALLKYGTQIERFKSRPGVYRKLKAIRQALKKINTYIEVI